MQDSRSISRPLRRTTILSHVPLRIPVDDLNDNSDESESDNTSDHQLPTEVKESQARNETSPLLIDNPDRVCSPKDNAKIDVTPKLSVPDFLHPESRSALRDLNRKPKKSVSDGNDLRRAKSASYVLGLLPPRTASVEVKKEPKPSPSDRSVPSQWQSASKAEREVPSERSVPSQLRSTSKAESEVPKSSVKFGKGDIDVNGKKYRVLSTLGKGGSSKVYEAYDYDKGQILAIKHVSLADADQSTASAYKNEITLLKKMQHSDRVIKLYDFEYSKKYNCLFLVLEKGDTDMSTVIRNYAKSDLITAEMIKFYWSEMLRTVWAIHAKGIIHSDLKPANFLLVSGKMKLIDFGIASSLQSDMTSVVKDTQMGTFNYMSPEAIQDAGQMSDFQSSEKKQPQIKIGVKSDVWSLGCILYTLVYGKTPFQQYAQLMAKINAITNPNHNITFPEIPDSDLLDVMKRCLIRNPKLRPSIDELLQHPYLEDRSKRKNEKVNHSAIDSQASGSASSVLKQLAALTPTSLRQVSKEFSKLSIKSKIRYKQIFMNIIDS